MRDVRSDFPILTVPENGKRLVYLDSAATAQRHVQVMDAVRAYAFHDNANPNRGVYDLDNRATLAHEHARDRVAGFLGASSDEIVFTQNATEGLNLVAYSWAIPFCKPGDRIVVAISEHHSNLVPWQRVAQVTGCTLSYLYPGPDGIYTHDALEQAILPDTKLVAIAHVSNVLGTMAPVSDVIRLAHSVGARVVLDIAQSVPHTPVNLHAMDVDFASFSGHKMYAPMGIGAVYIREELMDEMVPFLSGGDMIQSVHTSGTTYARGPRKFEAGTRNVHGEVGLEAAISYIESIGLGEMRDHEKMLMRRLMQGLEHIPEVEVIGTKDPDARYGVLSFNVKDVHPHDVATLLDFDGITVRAGHHCAQPLMDFLEIPSCARLSFGVYSTEEDVDAFLESISNIRRMMGFNG